MNKKTEIKFKVQTEKYAIPFLFGKIHNLLGYEVYKIKDSFPDVILRKDNKFYSCEFEYKSSNFKLHKHPQKGCDLIICWINDWEDCQIEIIQLSEYFVEKPDHQSETIIKDELENIEILKNKYREFEKKKKLERLEKIPIEQLESKKIELEKKIINKRIKEIQEEQTKQLTNIKSEDKLIKVIQNVEPYELRCSWCDLLFIKIPNPPNYMPQNYVNIKDKKLSLCSSCYKKYRERGK